jgi:hypothetical protein
VSKRPDGPGLLWTYCGPNDPLPPWMRSRDGKRGRLPFWYLDRPRRDRVQMSERLLVRYARESAKREGG